MHQYRGRQQLQLYECHNRIGRFEKTGTGDYLTIAVKSRSLNLTMSSPCAAIRNPFVSGNEATSLAGSTKMNGGVLVRKSLASCSLPSTTVLVMTLRNFHTRLGST